MQAIQTNPVFRGFIQGEVSQPIASKFGGYDRKATIIVDGYGEQQLWFRAGELTDYLEDGDQVALEYRNRWKLAKQQPEQLVFKLAARKKHAEQDAPAAIVTQPPAPPTATPPTATPQRNEVEILSSEIDRMMMIVSRLQRELSARGFTEEAIVKLACTIYIQTSKSA